MKDADFEAFCKEARDIPSGDLLSAYAVSHGVGFFDIEDTSINVTQEELRRWLLWCNYYGRPKEEYPLAMNQCCVKSPDGALHISGTGTKTRT